MGGILLPHVGCVPHPDFAALLLFAGAEDLMVTWRSTGGDGPRAGGRIQTPDLR